jgi:hypothetical protein
MKTLSMYENRVKLVQDTLTAHGELADAPAHDLAVRVLDALDHIPEKVR